MGSLGRNLLVATMVVLFDLASSTGYTYRGYCTQYCDVQGIGHRAFYCVDYTAYCCGNENYKYCCGNSTLEVNIPPVAYCTNSYWWQYSWNIMVGMLGALVALLLCCACCCQMWNSWGNSYHSTLVRRFRNQNDVNSVSELVIDDEPSRPDVYSPPSRPFTFHPPEYNSLPKDPPKYEDICEMTEGGNTNEGYEVEPTENACACATGLNSQGQGQSHAQEMDKEHVQAVPERSSAVLATSCISGEEGQPSGPPPPYEARDTANHHEE